MKNQSTTWSSTVPMPFFGGAPMSSFESGAFSIVLDGRSLWLHLRMIVPSLSNSKPGLLRIIVLSVVSSVKQNGYSAPVMSSQ